MRTPQEMIAYALEIDQALLPFAPALLADLEELGSDAERIVTILKSLNLPTSARVIDLGCGKGAVSIKIAQELGLQVLGIDLFAPFIDHCRAQAASAGVADRCHFRCADVLSAHEVEVGEVAAGEVAIMGALGDVLGPPDQSVGVVRKYVRPSGYMLISDGYLKDNSTAMIAGFENYKQRAETLSCLTAHGDVLIEEFVETPASADEEDEESDLILSRAQSLAQQHPHFAKALLDFAQEQRNENVFLNNNFVSAIWLLRRALT